MKQSTKDQYTNTGYTMRLERIRDKAGWTYGSTVERANPLVELHQRIEKNECAHCQQHLFLERLSEKFKKKRSLSIRQTKISIERKSTVIMRDRVDGVLP